MENLTKIKPTYSQPEVFQPTKLDKIIDAVADLATEEAALNRLDELLIEKVENAFEIGAVLFKMKDEEWFSGHMSFEEFCKARYGFRKSKGYQLMAIYHVLNKLQIPWDDVKEVGSAKLHFLCAQVVTKKLGPDEFSTHVENAKSKTFLEFQSALHGAGPKGSKMKAKDDGDSEHDAVAPESIDDQPVGQSPEDVKTGAEPEVTGDDSTDSGADAVKTSTKAVPNKLPEFDLDADPNPFVISHMKKIGESLTLTLCTKAFPGWPLIEEKY